MEEGANLAVIESRRRLYSEWYAWLNAEMEDIEYERGELGLPDPNEQALELQRTRSVKEGEEIVEEVVDEVIEETEEFV